MPCYAYLCHSCLYEFDKIQGHDAEKSMDCPRCEEENAARRILAAPASPRGSFGTTPRRGGKDKTQEFNFEEQDE